MAAAAAEAEMIDDHDDDKSADKRRQEKTRKEDVMKERRRRRRPRLISLSLSKREGKRRRFRSSGFLLMYNGKKVEEPHKQKPINKPK